MTLKSIDVFIERAKAKETRRIAVGASPMPNRQPGILFKCVQGMGL